MEDWKKIVHAVISIQIAGLRSRRSYETGTQAVMLDNQISAMNAALQDLTASTEQQETMHKLGLVPYPPTPRNFIGQGEPRAVISTACDICGCPDAYTTDESGLIDKCQNCGSERA